MKTYLEKDIQPSSCQVHYEVIDKDDKVISKNKVPSGYDSGNYAACFSQLFGYEIPKNAVKIIVTHPTNQIPYTEKNIQRWCADLNEIGFPFEFQGYKNGQARFEIDLKTVRYKSLLCSILTLIRVPYENYSYKVPEKYFQIMDTFRRRNKLIALQQAHKDPVVGASHIGHNILGKGETGANIDEKTLFERFKKSGSVYDKDRPNLNIIWRA